MKLTVYDMVACGIPEGNIVATIMAREAKETTMNFVGWGNSDASIRISDPLDLGIGPQPGLRRFPRLDRIVHAAAMGYVSGFPVKDIVWYLLTRHTPYWHRYATREMPGNHCSQAKRDGEWVGTCKKCIRKLGTDRMPWKLHEADVASTE